MVGSHEFYLGYAVSRQKLLTLDAGHFHPTEDIADKISSVLLLRAGDRCCTSAAACAGTATTWSPSPTTCRPSPRKSCWGGYLDRVHIGLDYFDASINRVAAWVIGTRNMIKALLLALVEPIDQLQQLEADGRFHLAPGPDGRGQDPAVRRGVGLLLPEDGRARGRCLARRGQAVREGRALQAAVADGEFRVLNSEFWILSDEF